MDTPGSRFYVGDGLVRPLDHASRFNRAVARHHTTVRKDIGPPHVSVLWCELDHVLAKTIVARAISANQKQTGVGKGIIVQWPRQEVGLSIFGGRLVPLAHVGVAAGPDHGSLRRP